MKQAAKTVTLIGAIVETIIHVILIFSTLGIWIIPAAAFIPLSWVAHNKASQGFKGWAIYGIIQSIFFNTIGLVGHILHVIHLSSEEQATLGK
jgi:hypothetical protein